MVAERKNIAFFGAFLSKRSGTKGVIEKITEKLRRDPEAQIKLISRHPWGWVRVMHQAWQAIFGNIQLAHLDVYSGRSFFISYGIAFLLKRRGIPFIVTLRGGRLPEFYRQHTGVVRRLILMAERAQTPSLYLEDFFRKEGLKLEYLPNPIDLELFEPPMAGASRTPCSILWVRAFDPIYNPFLPVDILHLLHDRYPAARLTMIGPDKGFLAQTRKHIAKLHLESSIDIVGPVPNEQLPKWYGAHSVFLNTTRYESFGAAVLEAAACEIPIVSTAVGELPLLWKDREEVFLVDSQKAEDFLAPLDQIFGQPQVARQISCNARNKALQFHFEPILSEWKQLLLN